MQAVTGLIELVPLSVRVDPVFNELHNGVKVNSYIVHVPVRSVVGSNPTLGSSFVVGKVTALGVPPLPPFHLFPDAEERRPSPEADHATGSARSHASSWSQDE